MTDSTRDYLKRRAQELNLGREDSLAQIQKLLDGRYAGQTRALSLNDGVLKVATPNASVASELRLNQVELLGLIKALDPAVERLSAQIRAL